MKISIFHNAGDFSYLFGLVNGLSKQRDIKIDVIDSAQSIIPFKEFKNVSVYEFILPFKKTYNPFYRIFRILLPYIKNIIYTIKSDSIIFHIQWFNRIHSIDKLFLINFYHLFKKKVVYTAHNVNTMERNNRDSFWNRITLKYYYNNLDHIIVHNKKSRAELISKFGVSEEKVSVIKFGLNIFTPIKGINKKTALQKLGLPSDKKIILFFGAINVYKGLEYLLDAYEDIIKADKNFHLVIAGESRDDNYFSKISSIIKNKFSDNTVTTFFRYLEEEEIEYFFAAADCVVLPYKAISQSGVHFLSYSFGLPVIATDVGSFKDEDIIEGITGFVCKSEDSNSIKETILKYFSSDLYKNLETNREKIRQWASNTYNWDNIAVDTIRLYKNLLNK